MTGSADSPSLPPETRLGRTALSVHDLDAVTEFYRTVVGLAVLARDDGTATLGVDGTPLLVLRRDADAPPRGRDQAGLFHNAFRLPSRAALGAALERISDGWTLDGASDHDVSEALYLSDPEGNGVEIYRDRPRAEWPRTADGGVEMATRPLDLDDIAAESNGGSTAPEGTTLGHVHLEVTSVPTARDFYVETLGFEVRMDAGAALFVAAGGYHHHLGLNAWNGRSSPAGGRGLAWFEVLVPDDAAVRAVRERLAGADVAVAERDGGIEFEAPDGVTVRLRAE
ncbi:VOC family protein [Halobellus limi]|uniref:Catechol 2,3-dioxygenase n=1 Tax=Halobellus limi TaxID=699433 RepID=A0A1H6BH43_9EURY|nr:VOC family protein [Halobellus limi]QCC49033.1 VOC family protein [Halobellus limi]SEG59944.1 catechol 2,3-dioxygenase [Halobellus limi]